MKWLLLSVFAFVVVLIILFWVSNSRKKSRFAMNIVRNGRRWWDSYQLMPPRTELPWINFGPSSKQVLRNLERRGLIEKREFNEGTNGEVVVKYRYLPYPKPN